jgi:hypothetical protein
MNVEKFFNKSTFIFSNLEDPDEPIAFALDDWDHNHIMHWLEKHRTIGKVINIAKPAEMSRLTGLLSIKEHLPIMKQIVEHNWEPIEID